MVLRYAWKAQSSRAFLFKASKCRQPSSRIGSSKVLLPVIRRRQPAWGVTWPMAPESSGFSFRLDCARASPVAAACSVVLLIRVGTNDVRSASYTGTCLCSHVKSPPDVSDMQLLVCTCVTRSSRCYVLNRLYSLRMTRTRGETGCIACGVICLIHRCRRHQLSHVHPMV